MSKSNDDWFASVKECFSCGSKNLEIRTRARFEILYCRDCNSPVAGQPVSE